MPDVEIVVGQVVPIIGAAVGAYGADVLTRAQDAAADATVGLGRRMLARILHLAPQRAPLETVVTQLASSLEDPDAMAALRFQVRQILDQNPEIVAELAGMLPTDASGSRSVVITGDSKSTFTLGDHSPIVGLG